MIEFHNPNHHHNHEAIKNDGGDTKKFMAKAKDKNDAFRLMGFGHRVYKNFDPRARIIKKAAHDVLKDLGIEDPILEIAKSLEEEALNDPYFTTRKLYPNVDFYSTHSCTNSTFIVNIITSSRNN